MAPRKRSIKQTEQLADARRQRRAAASGEPASTRDDMRLLRSVHVLMLPHLSRHTTLHGHVSVCAGAMISGTGTGRGDAAVVLVEASASAVTPMEADASTGAIVAARAFNVPAHAFCDAGLLACSHWQVQTTRDEAAEAVPTRTASRTGQGAPLHPHPGQWPPPPSWSPTPHSWGALALRRHGPRVDPAACGWRREFGPRALGHVVRAL